MSCLLSRLATAPLALCGLEASASPRFLNPRRASCLISNLYLVPSIQVGWCLPKSLSVNLSVYLQ